MTDTLIRALEAIHASTWRQPIPFPTSKIQPSEDPTERAFYDVSRCVTTFQEALKSANPYRARQLSERLAECINWLVAVEAAAAQQAKE